MKVKTTDKIVLDVIKKMDERSLVGQKKYGQTMTDEVEQGMKDLNDFLDDTQEEIMDALLYIQAAKKCLGDKIIYSYPDEEEN
jgi:predicted polyphosphate/ATP-dependent NAD kinase|tara:strand:- start:1627 stop:1875 length:249 start_codon:yes stop_codon:yes gene_type:complete